MNCYPVCLTKLNHTSCVVVGGGNVAERKICVLLEAGAAVKVISPRLTANMQRLAAEGKIEHISRSYRSGDLEGAFLVIAATNDSTVNQAVAQEAAERQRLINIVDEPQLGNFTVPATISRGALMISISTSGTSPALAAHIRKQLEHVFGPEYADFTEILGEMRGPVTELCPPEHRRELWYQLIDSDILDCLRQGELQTARDSAKHIVDAYISTLGKEDDTWKSSRLV
jgi:precorrin-2 dehydrogenase/sirohydrochlorin ferrochelatase